MKLDLHGYTVHNAWHAFTEHLSDCYYKGVKETVIVTGHGQIGNEIIAWVHNNPHARYCERMDPNTGAYNVKLHKKKSTDVVTKKQQVDLSKLLDKYNKTN